MRVLESGGTVEQHKAAVAVATAMKFDGVNCPTPNCDGTGNINGTFLTWVFHTCYVNECRFLTVFVTLNRHRASSGCPLLSQGHIKKPKYDDTPVSIYSKGYTGKFLLLHIRILWAQQNISKPSLKIKSLKHTFC